MKDQPSKLQSALRAFGFIDGLLYLLDRFLDRCGSKVRIFSYLLVAQPVPQEAPGGSMMRDVTSRMLQPGDPVLAAFPLDDEVLQFRFGQGAKCLGVWRKDVLLGCFWMHRGTFLEDEVRCRFEPSPEVTTVWDFDVYLMPEHRLGRGFLQLWHAAFAFMRQEGIEWSVSRISGFNERSRKSHAALGARTVGRAVYAKGRKRQLTLSSLSPFVHWSGSVDRLPTIRIRVPAEPRS